MKKNIFLAVAFALLALLASCASTKSPTSSTTSAAPDVYTVTFIVDGVSLSVQAPVGELPVYPSGIPTKAATKDAGYRFSHWDSPIVPACADMTYTAVFETVASYPVRWVLPHEIVTTYVSEGEIPVYGGSLDFAPDAEFTYAFDRWDQEPVAVTAQNCSRAIYTAICTTSVRSYAVTFISGDTVLSVQEVAYGTTPNAPSVPDQNGRRFSAWTPMVVPVKGEATYSALYANPNERGLHIKLPDEIISRCLDEVLIDFEIGNGQKTAPLNGTTSTFFLLVEEYFNPGSEQIVSRIHEQLHSLVAGGNEPDLDLGWQWSPANCAAVIAMAKATPTVWSTMPASDAERLDFLMHLLTYASAFGTNDCNDYRTTLKMAGNYNKGWNPNYRLTATVPILAAGQYFGSAEAVDAVLAAFDYDAAVAKCTEYGFVNALENLTKAGKSLMENGGTAYGEDGTAYGSGLGVKQPYLYKTFSLNESHKILNSLLEYNYSGGAVVSSFEDASGALIAYVEGQLTSPYEGKLGMFLELGGSDQGGVRSSAGYSLGDFNMVTVALTMLMSLGDYDVEEHMTQSLQNKLWVGNGDLLFKLKNGYHGYAKGEPEEVVEYTDYASLFTLETFWCEILADKHVDYVELSKFVLTYELADGSKISEGSDTPDVTLSDRLSVGYVWYDGSAYYHGGVSYSCLAEGETVLRAVRATGVENGASLIGKMTDTLLLSAGDTSKNPSKTFKTGDLVSGKILSIVTISSPSGQVPDYFEYQHKHLDAPNPATNLFIGKNGALYTSQDVKICDYDGTAVTLAIAYDTASTVGQIFLLKDGAYELVATYPIANTDGTVGRFGYFYLPNKKQNDHSRDHRVDFTASYYLGLSHPIDRPVKYPLVLIESGEETRSFYTVGTDGTLPLPARTEGFRGWMNEAGETVSAIAPDFFGTLTLRAVYENEGYFYSYLVDGVPTVLESENSRIVLSCELLPAGHMWFDGEKYYNGGFEYLLSPSESTVFTAVLGAGIDGAYALTAKTQSGKVEIKSTATVGGQFRYDAPTPSETLSGKVFIELTFSSGDYVLPGHLRLNYKHTGAASPESNLIHCDNGRIYAWDVDGSTKNDTYICDYADGLRLAIGYDTVDSTVSVYYYDIVGEGWRLGASFTALARNELGTGGRLLYFYIPTSQKPSSSDEIYGVSFTFDAYLGITAPVSAPLLGD